MILVTPEERAAERLASYRTALSKLAQHQTDEKLLLFNLAARAYFWTKNPSAKIIEKLGREEAAKLTLDEFLAKVGDEMPPESKVPKKLRIHRML